MSCDAQPKWFKKQTPGKINRLGAGEKGRGYGINEQKVKLKWNIGLY